MKPTIINLNDPALIKRLASAGPGEVVSISYVPPGGSVQVVGQVSADSLSLGEDEDEF